MVPNVRSPLNDLLEKDDFTLEQVLEEDELIQEVKTRNTKLLELYVSTRFRFMRVWTGDSNPH